MKKEPGIIIVKVGTNILTANGDKLNRSLIRNLVKQLVELHNMGYKSVLVTSGAVAAGKEITKLSDNMESITQRQIYAAVGQARLMHEYEKLFQKLGVVVGQALLTREDFADRTRYDNALRALYGMINNNIVPIINENDVVTVEELSFGDNDVLAAATAIALNADKLLLLTNQEGVMTANPEKNKRDAKLIRNIKDVNEIFSAISDNSSSTHGIGGMHSKVNAAQLSANAGIPTWIANGLHPENITAIINGKKIGTNLIAKVSKLSEKERWILCAKNASAGIIIDDGAAQALLKKKSLLMVGVKKIRGCFDKKEIVEVVDRRENIVGYGITNYSSDELTKALDRPHSLKKEVIHINNLHIA
ncbi:MAG: glutamate 5-kinase [Patescibacteria group bacterium]|jgi:glutamate 5-kinase